MIKLKKFKELASLRGENFISFFIPTHRASQSREDQIYYKNQLGKVERQLEDQGVDGERITALLKQAREKLEDREFWLHQSDGLATYIYNGKTEWFSLPISFEPLAFLADRLYLKPLVPVLFGDHPFLLLAVSQNAIRYFSGARYSIAEIEQQGKFPKNLEHALKYDVVQENLQHHSGQGKSGQPIFHGQGEKQERSDVLLKEYLRLVDQGVMALKCADDREPLILAADDGLANKYREINSYPYLYEKHISGNPEKDDPVLLHEKAWMLLEPELRKAFDREKKDFEQQLADKRATFSLQEIVPAAIGGRIATLFVERGSEVYGLYDEHNHRVVVHEERREDSIPLLNEAVVATVNNGGKVHLLDREELPRPTASANAILRYVAEPV